MAKVDADISYLLSHIIIPVLIFILASRYFFGLRLKKLNSMIMRRMCTHLHHTYLEKEKQLLFEHLGDLKRCCSGPFSILEIGVGGGENFKFYPKGTQFSCVDPNRHHDECIKMKLEKHRHIKLVECLHAYAEDMPDIKSNSYNVVVSTLTLCTVRDPAAVLGEIHRVLKPGGTFYNMEHVAGQKGSVIRFIQDLLTNYTPYSSLTGGCNMNRETWAHLDQSSFKSVQYRQYSINTWLFFFMRPFMYGTAVK